MRKWQIRKTVRTDILVNFTEEAFGLVEAIVLGQNAGR